MENLSAFSHEPNEILCTWSKHNPPRVKIHTPLVQYTSYGPVGLPLGFVSDGASIPRLVRWYHDPFDVRTQRAAYIHDLLCAKWPFMDRIWHIGTHKQAHEIFAEGCKAGGLHGRRFQAVTKAVKLFGPRWPDAYTVPLHEANDLLSFFTFQWQVDD